MFTHMILMLRVALYRLGVDEEGQDLVEYALLLGLIAIIAIVAITASGVAIKGIWETIQGKLEAITIS